MVKSYKPEYYQKHKERMLAAHKKWVEDNRELTRTYATKWRTEHIDICHSYGRKFREKSKLEALSHYSFLGKPMCINCGEEDIDVLCIDHILNNGKEERPIFGQGCGSKFYRRLKNNNYPQGYQVLCSNCNLKKEIERQRNGYS